MALFCVSPVAALVAWLELGSNQAAASSSTSWPGEIWTGHYLWGYMFTAVAVALLPLGLLAYERGRSGRRPALVAAAAAAGLLCSWLQPWQGVTFALVIVGAEAALPARALRDLGRRADRARPAAGRWRPPPLPLVYYLILSHTDATWELAGQANADGGWPLWVMVVGLAPLAMPALFAYRRPRRATSAPWRCGSGRWPPCAVFYLPAGTFPAHAMQGLTIPLAILAALGVRRLLGSRPLPACAGGGRAALLVVPGLAHRVDQLRGAVNGGLQPFFLEPSEHDALRHLDGCAEEGGVLTTVFSGQAVPAYTGRATWLGATSWTPDFKAAAAPTDRLFSGRLDAGGAPHGS